MDELVEVINKLQNVFLVSGTRGIDLPQIVVVGMQSSGKSSVLEHIVGESFLPRGTGIVTRCPLVLQLVQARSESARQYGIFQHNKSKLFTDYKEITKEIEKETERLAPGNKEICLTPIFLKLFSPSFVNLTLVDLPGLTKVPVGDQPEDIEDQTTKLILSFIEKPNSIILAVSPANVDLANSESLKLAKQVDPESRRTLAVITKLDLMDEGTDARDILTGKVIPVKLGIIGVVNRSQKSIQDGKTIAQSLKDEAEFFKANYRSIASNHGCLYLINKVQRILVNKIKACLPELMDDIKQKLYTKNEKLKKIGEGIIDKQKRLIDLLTQFSNTFKVTINGRLKNVQTKELSGGAKINYMFQEYLSKNLKRIDALSGLSEDGIQTAMKNSSGVNSMMFVSEATFELLMKGQIELLRKPCLDCVDMVFKELNNIVQVCITDSDMELGNYPKLQREINRVVTELLRDRLPITKEMVEHLVNIQKAFINKDHPDFVPNALKSFAALSGEGQSSDKLLENKEQRMKQNYVLINKLIHSYFSITQNSFQDIVPKIIMHFLVGYVMDKIQPTLTYELYGDNSDELLEESEDVLNKRKELMKDIEALEKATDIINEISPAVLVTKVGDNLNLKKQQSSKDRERSDV